MARLLGTLRAGITAAVALLVLCGAAHAAVYNAVPAGDSTDGQCGLSEAIQAANGNPPLDTACGPASPGTADIVNVAPGQYAEPAGLFVAEAVDIRGAAAATTTIDAQHTARVLLIQGGPVTVRDVTMTGGRTPNGDSFNPAYPAGGIWVQNGVSLTLQRVVVTGNATGRGVDGGGMGSGVNPGRGADGGGVYATGPLTIIDSTISSNTTGGGGNGSSGTGQTGNAGGDGAGIYTTGPLTITGSRITSNSTGAGGAGADGGSNGLNGGNGGDGAGIWTNAAATITNSVIDNNHAGAGGRGGSGSTTSATGGFGGDAGGALAQASLTLNGTTVSDNSAGAGGAAGSGSGAGNGGRGGFGGGIQHVAGTLAISDSAITGNRSGAGAASNLGGNGGQGGTAGGLMAQAFGQPVTITRTTISGNATGAGGNGGTGAAGTGGLAGGLYGAGTALTLTDSTISGNTTGKGGSAQSNPAASGRGGGLAFESSQPLTTTNATISGNTTGAGGDALGGLNPGAGSGTGAGAFLGGVAMTFRNVTVAGNQAGPGGSGNSNGGQGNGPGIHVSTGTLTIAASVVSGNGGPGCSTVGGGQLTDGGHDISFPDGSCPGTVADPLLAALADNGGPTRTMALTAGSPAIDLVPADGNCPATDQRGVARPVGAACDAGAFEYQPPPNAAGAAPQTTGTTADKTAPHVRLLLSKQRLRKVLRRGYVVRFSTDEAGRADVALFADSRLLAARSVRVARGSMRAAKAGTNRVVAKFTKKARRRLARRRSVRFRVVLRVTDAAGNATSKSARVTVKR